MSMVVLIGVTGSGKTTVGWILSQRYALPLYEVDDAVEESLGAPMRTLVVGGGPRRPPAAPAPAPPRVDSVF